MLQRCNLNRLYLNANAKEKQNTRLFIMITNKALFRPLFMVFLHHD